MFPGGKVLITGGTGNVGKAATQRLVEKGWDVLVVGRRAGIEIPGAAYAVCDVTCHDDLRQKMAGRDAVVHLAAVPHPSGAPGPELMRANVLGTYNVFEAAATEGIRRIVQASSINALGCFYGVADLDHVQYFPIDEAHPTYTTDPYSFSKVLIEAVGEYYWRRDGISSVALRLPWVHPAGFSVSERHRQDMARTRAVLDEMAALPAPERLARLEAARQKAMACRRQRPLDHGARERGVSARGLHDDPLSAMYFWRRPNFWTFVDERDSAQSIEKGLTASYDGAHVLFINDSHNWLLYDTETILGLFFPEVTRRTRPIRGCESLVGIDKARELIGFEPEYSIARLMAQSAEGPGQ